jgi:nucleoside 2-deoxyribosyltransferase
MIYIAAPLFNPSERALNAHLRSIIPYPTYLPQEDGGLLTNLLESGIAFEAAVRTVFQNDLKALERCDVMVAVLDGPHVDSGVAFEIGYFHALNKPIVGFHTDRRSELPTGLNPMLLGSISVIATTENELVVTLNQIQLET